MIIHDNNTISIYKVIATNNVPTLLTYTFVSTKFGVKPFCNKYMSMWAYQAYILCLGHIGFSLI